jgi:glycosyltransferase involved in cell wall biosynthesis
VNVLYVAYPMLPVSEASCGGAEQMLWALEAEMARRGHGTVVAACEGSQVAGKLLATGAAPAEMDAFEAREAEHEVSVLKSLAANTEAPFDLVHDKGGSFWRRAAEVDAPVLATLHLPRSFYPADAFEAPPPNLFFNCVSQAQWRTFAGVPQVLGAIANGIRLEYFPPPREEREDYLLWVGRICPEKGTHIAIEVARRAGMPLVIAGDVYPFSFHQAYFEREVRPHLEGRNASVFYAGAPRFSEKLRLLRRARALLVTTLAEETSSLVAMEASACGTPVLAFGRGALPEVVSEDVTGFIVHTAEEMVKAVASADRLSRKAARKYAEQHYSARLMAAQYEQAYRSVIDCRAGTLAVPPARILNGGRESPSRI